MKKVILGVAVLSVGISANLFANGGSSRKDRIEKIYDRLPEDVQQQVDTYKDERQELRAALKAIIADLGEDVTAEERKAAIEQFREENADAIAARREAAKETWELVRENRPERAERPEVTEEIQALIDQRKADKDALKEARDAAIAELGEEATREEKKAAIEAFNEANADAIAALKETGQLIRDAIREARDDSEEVVAVDEGTEDVVSGNESLEDLRKFIPEDVKGLIPDDVEELVSDEEVRTALKTFREQRKQVLEEAKRLRSELDGLSEEEIRAKFEEIRDSRRQALKDLKQARREARENAVDDAGDERSE